MIPEVMHISSLSRCPSGSPSAARPRREAPGRPNLLALACLLLLALFVSGWPPTGLSAPADKAASGTSPPAATAPGVPLPAEIEARIKETEASKTLDEAAKTALLEAYRRTSAYLDSARDFATQTAEYKQAVTEAPDQTAAIRKQLQTEPGDDDQPSPRALAALSAAELSQRLTTTQAEATALEARIAEIDKALEGTNSRPAAARARLAEVRQALDDLEAEAARPTAPDQSAEQIQAGTWTLAARRAALTAETQALEQELTSQGARDALHRAQREQAGVTLTQVKERLRRMEEVQDQRRKAEAEQARRETAAAQRDAVDKHPLVQETAKANAALTASLGDLAAQLNQFGDLLAQTKGERDRIEADFRGARERIGVAGVNQILGEVLIDRRNELPDLRKHRKEMAERSELIAAATLQQIHHREEQRALRDLDTAITALSAAAPDAQTEQVRAELKELLTMRRGLIDKALAGGEEFIRKQGELNDAAEQLIQTATAYDNFLARHLLWVRSARPISLDSLASLPSAVTWMLARGNWTEVVQVLGFELRHSPLAWLGLLTLLVLFWRQAAIKRAILASAEPLRRVRTDRFVHTLEAIGLTALAALPLPLACLLLGRELAASIEATGFTRAVGGALTQVAMGFYFLRGFRLTCIPGGVADRHFRWESDVLVQIRRNLRWFTPYILVTSLIAYTIYLNHDTARGESLGRIVLIAGMIGTAVFLGRLLHPRTGVFAHTLTANPAAWANRLRNVWYPIIVGAPLALGALAVLGYLYTAGTLFQSLVQTAWLALGLVLVQQVIMRWLVYTRRHLAFQAAMERQTARRVQAEAASAKAGALERESDAGTPVREPGAGPAVAEEPEVDLASLDEQTRKLLNATVFLLAVLGLWLIWSAMLPALAVFEQMALWNYSSVVDGAARLIPVTAADLGLVVVILFVALVAAKNLPALIEILLLQNSQVNAGTRYAVRTLVSYAITAIAVVMAFGTLGLSWSKIQWLVAALSVGIGFGLQEIVANFISGLIILFERPVRVGDTVTIANTTGTVTKIEIRATTIRNWDRQELIVPNKEFITGRLLNWTLSDQINRIVITVGIEYGSDARLALTLLTETAAANPHVLKEPPPLASLDTFGDNALTLTLRCFLDAMDLRVGVTTELHLAIERSFREHGILIAFPQRDINVRAGNPITVRLYQGEQGAADGTLTDAQSRAKDSPGITEHPATVSQRPPDRVAGLERDNQIQGRV